jgi:hypothetical protein
MNTVIDIAQEIYHELFEPSDISIGSIIFWLRANIGELNTRIVGSYALDTELMNITPELSDEAKAIFKKMYQLHYTNKQIRDNLGASGIQSVIEVDEFGSKVKMTNKTETAKTYVVLRKEIVIELDRMINDFRSNEASPRQVCGDDTLSDNGVNYDTRETRIS